MPAPRVAPLVEAIRHHLPHVPKHDKGWRARATWSAPPRVVGAVTLSGVPIAPYMDFVKDSLDDLRGVYEEYIHYYITRAEANPQTPREFLLRRLNLDPKVAEWLLGREVFMTEGRPLAALTAMAANKLGTLPFIGAAGVVLDVGGGTLMGIQSNGLVISKYAKDTYLPVEDYRRFLLSDSETHQSGGSASLSLFYRAALAVSNPEMRRALSLALRVLFYRYSHLGRLTAYLYDGVRPRSPRGVNKNAQVAKVRRQFLDPSNPMPMMWRELVETGAIAEDVFMEAFGKDTSYRNEDVDAGIDPAVIVQWSRILKSMGKQH